MTRPIIGLIGKAGSGKDTFAARLVEEHGYTRVAGADPLKEMALRIDPYILDPREVDLAPKRLSQVVAGAGWDVAKSIPEGRRFLQRLGVSVRELDEDFWAKRMLDRVAEVDGPVVVTDVRFPNEADGVLSLRSSQLVRIVRPSQELGETHQHASETALDDYLVNRTVMNDSDIKMLHANADVFARYVAGERELIK